VTGVERIAKERLRQESEEGWSGDHDDDHISGELALAAACYAAPTRLYTAERNAQGHRFMDPWPWDSCWDKRPRDKSGNLREGTREERIRDLVKAGALVAAEIDRLEREGQEA